MMTFEVAASFANVREKQSTHLAIERQLRALSTVVIELQRERDELTAKVERARAEWIEADRGYRETCQASHNGPAIFVVLAVQGLDDAKYVTVELVSANNAADCRGIAEELEKFVESEQFIETIGALQNG